MSKFSKTISAITASLIALISVSGATPASAIGQFAVSPMYQLITLTPGETYIGNFQIINPADHQYDFYYSVSVEPFTTGDDYDLTFTSNEDYNLITDWIKVYEPEGVIAPNETAEIRFSIDVPKDAPAGGQYVALTVSSAQYNLDTTMVDIKQTYAASHLIYADVAGETIRKGSITDVNVPSFLFSGNITGSASIKNEGNVHSQSTQTLQVFPFFSKEEVFTNEEDPKTSWIMPGATNYSSVAWEGTPSLGVFHVIYNVEYEGVEANVDKIVIVCPLWLLFILVACIFAVLFAIIFGGKKEKR